MDNKEFIEFMDDLSLSVEEMARMAGIDARNVRRIRAEKIPVPKTVVKLMEAELFIAKLFDDCVGPMGDVHKINRIMEKVENRWRDYGSFNNKDA